MLCSNTGRLGDYHTKRSKSGRKRQTLYGIIYIRKLKKVMQMNLFLKQKQTPDLKNKLMVTGGGMDILQVWDGYVHTAILKKDSQQGLSVQTRNSA